MPEIVNKPECTVSIPMILLISVFDNVQQNCPPSSFMSARRGFVVFPNVLLFPLYAILRPSCSQSCQNLNFRYNWNQFLKLGYTTFPGKLTIHRNDFSSIIAIRNKFVMPEIVYKVEKLLIYFSQYTAFPGILLFLVFYVYWYSSDTQK